MSLSYLINYFIITATITQSRINIEHIKKTIIQFTSGYNVCVYVYSFVYFLLFLMAQTDSNLLFVSK